MENNKGNNRHSSGTVLYADGLVTGNGGKALTRDISFRMVRGECVLLCGANGTGKSTLMRTLAGVIPSYGGEYGPSGTRTALIPARIPKVGGFSVTDFIAAGCFKDSDWLGRLPARRSALILKNLELLGIRGLAEKDISGLSDGEFQKAAIASALMQEADVIMLDEPTAFLDVDSRDSVLACLGRLAGEQKVSIIFSSHDIRTAVRHCSRVFGLADAGKEAGHGETIFMDSGADASPEDMDFILSRCFRSFHATALSFKVK